jgi:hypothetical protein
MSKVQSILFVKDGEYNTQEKQKEWMKENNFKLMKGKQVHNTDNFARYRLFKPIDDKIYRMKKVNNNIYFMIQFDKPVEPEPEPEPIDDKKQDANKYLMIILHHKYNIDNLDDIINKKRTIISLLKEIRKEQSKQIEGSKKYILFEDIINNIKIAVNK